MITTSTSHITNTFTNAFRLTVAAGLGVAILFTLVEPQVTHSQVTETFTIKTSVVGESSFLVPPSDVVMTGTLNGLTGGSATGSTQFVVQSNSVSGYTVDISFEDNGSGNAMIGDTTGNQAIVDYEGDEAGPEPSFGLATSTSAQFAYTVLSTTTSDTVQSFRASGGSCNEGAGTAVGTCWKAPDVGDFPIIARGGVATDGATSTIVFNVTIPNNPTPVPAAEGYTATATLSLLTI